MRDRNVLKVSINKCCLRNVVFCVIKYFASVETKVNNISLIEVCYYERIVIEIIGVAFL